MSFNLQHMRAWIIKTRFRLEVEDACSVQEICSCFNNQCVWFISA